MWLKLLQAQLCSRGRHSDIRIDYGCDWGHNLVWERSPGALNQTFCNSPRARSCVCFENQVGTIQRLNKTMALRVDEI